jgi:predicted pyridoxine 5'-phosphate oxidase superfamily flavin-nucleotide-binding protein
MGAADLPGWPHAEPAFHAGEQALQARAGLGERMAEVGARVVRAQMPDQHRELFGKLPFMLVGALDAHRHPWAMVAAGAPGFVRTPDAQTLTMAAQPLGAADVPVALSAGTPLGLLGIEPATRRRNRVNGVVAAADAGSLTLQVRQSFGNCAKYIQARSLRPVMAQPHPVQAFGSALPPAALRLIEQADTFFIATASADAGRPQAATNGGVDVSHRGGKPGFVRVQQHEGRTTLTAPDFLGNFFFNTFGNIATHPWAGLLFIDWTGGDLLMLTGRAEVLWDGPEREAFAGAQRLLKLEVAEGRWLPGAMPWRADGAADYAPQLAATGSWEAVTAALR